MQNYANLLLLFFIPCLECSSTSLVVQGVFLFFFLHFSCGLGFSSVSQQFGLIRALIQRCILLAKKFREARHTALGLVVIANSEGQNGCFCNGTFQQGPSCSSPHPVVQYSHRIWLLIQWLVPAWRKYLKRAEKLADVFSKRGQPVYKSFSKPVGENC